MRMKAIRDAQARTRMELMASNPPPRPPQPSERERDEAHRLLAEQMVQRSLSMQVEALRRREVMKHQMILQRQVENERAKMEEYELCIAARSSGVILCSAFGSDLVARRVICYRWNSNRASTSKETMRGCSIS